MYHKILFDNSIIQQNHWMNDSVPVQVCLLRFLNDDENLNPHSDNSLVLRL